MAGGSIPSVPGARWWKFDFHTHTPASEDYGKGPKQAELKAVTHEEWVLAFMRAGIDCVAVTDHNTGEWVDGTVAAIAALREKGHEDLRKLTIFPGMEITVNGGVHLLAIMPTETKSEDIAALRGAVGYEGTPGKSDGVTTKTLTQVVGEVVKAGGLAIPAHVDTEKGIFYEQGGQTLGQAVASQNIIAMERCDPKSATPAIYESGRADWTRVLGSDSHHPTGSPGQRYAGSHYTWVKMASPTMEGLRLALLDGALSTKCSDEVNGNPNRHSELWIQSIEVENARYVGRAKPLEVRFSPWLTTLIGGRGSGKSTFVELVRLCLDRQDDLPESFRQDFAKYFESYSHRSEPGLLTDDAQLVVRYRKDETDFRIIWRYGSEPEMEQQDGGSWLPIDGDLRQRFPVRIYSQKEIFHLAKRPRALLHVIDEATEVGGAEWKSEFDELASRYRGIKAHIRELDTGLEEERRTKGEREDVERRLGVFEKAGYAETLAAYRKATSQEAAVSEFDEGVKDVVSGALDFLANLEVPELDMESFSDEDPIDEQVVKAARQVSKEVGKAIESARASLASLSHEKTDSAEWNERVGQAKQQYQELVDGLPEEEGGPSDYARLVERRAELEKKQKRHDAARREIEDAGQELQKCYGAICSKRAELTTRRKAFLADVLDGNKHVNIDLLEFGDRTHSTEEVRHLIKRPERLDSDIGRPDEDGLMAVLFPPDMDQEIDVSQVQTFKDELHELHEGGTGTQAYSSYLAKAVGGLSPEDMDAIDLWFPEDSLTISYCPRGDGKRFQSIESGSPGQMTAALLAFLMSYSRQPLILDQPEDDLDNQLIYELIVSHLRDEKTTRQVIVVTHNPNIVVNGDAEYVVALSASGGGTVIEHHGSLQDSAVREAICKIMEGGRKAFDMRYRRIALEANG